jgi:hypothetical protein
MGLKVFISLGLTLLVGLVLAWPLTFIGINLFSGLAFFTVLQVVGFYFYRDITEKKLAIETEKLIIAREAELSKQGTVVTCPCDRVVPCFVPVVLNEKNDYICPGCKKQVNIHVNIKTAIATIPIATDPQIILQQQIEKEI